MKGHKSEHHRKNREAGGVNYAEDDVKTKPMRYTEGKPEDEAEERKSGGHVRKKRKSGGHVHHEDMANLKHAKHIGHVHGEHAKHHAGRKPRKNGGRTGSDAHPFSSARRGEDPPGHKTEMESD